MPRTSAPLLPRLVLIWAPRASSTAATCDLGNSVAVAMLASSSVVIIVAGGPVRQDRLVARGIRRANVRGDGHLLRCGVGRVVHVQTELRATNLPGCRDPQSRAPAFPSLDLPRRPVFFWAGATGWDQVDGRRFLTMRHSPGCSRPAIKSSTITVRAVDDFRAANAIQDEIQHIDWTGIFWRRETT